MTPSRRISLGHRCLSSDAKDSASPSTVWERQAVSIKNTDINSDYLDAMRAETDPALHLKTIEDELKGTIGKALGRQGDKILSAVRRMSQEYQVYHDESSCINTRQQAARRHNEFRKQALQARWELTVHRQAAGFIVNNHKYVTDQYPIAQALPETKDEEAGMNKPEQPEKKKQFTDQLDWWQRIGRWR